MSSLNKVRLMKGRIFFVKDDYKIAMIVLKM